MCVKSKLPVVFASAILLFGTHACGGSNPIPEATSTPLFSTTTLSPSPTPVNPQILLQEAGQVMESLRSFHFRLTHRSGATPFASIVLDEAEGDVVSPDKLSVSISGTFGRFAVRSGIIALGDDNYMLNFVTKDWDKFPTGVSPMGFFTPRRGIAAMMSQVVQPTVTKDGPGTYRVKGSLAAEALAPLLGATVKDSSVDVEIEIDADYLYLMEAIVEGRVTPDEPDGVVRVIKLSRFNEPVTIEAPR